MKTLFFFSVVDFSNWKTDGICKKILMQVKAFRDMGYAVDFCYTCNGDTYIDSDSEKKCIGKKRGLVIRKSVCNSVAQYIRDKNYNAVYIRYCFAEESFISLLKSFKNKSDKVVVEIPTYPYDKEFCNGLARKMLLLLDKCYRNKMHKYVDRIATFSEDKIIFNVPTIQIVNGIDFSKIKPRKVTEEKDTINIIAVASMASWHGYDRLLEGLGKYYLNNGGRRIRLHLVGDGEEVPNYINIIEKYGIQEYVDLHGNQSGEELDAIYDYCDLAVASLGIHRKGIYLSSELKTREYAAKGLPMITSCNIDVFPLLDCSFIHKVSEDDQALNIEGIVSFYDEIYANKDKKAVVCEIREFAKKVCDISVTMKRVETYYKGL